MQRRTLLWVFELTLFAPGQSQSQVPCLDQFADKTSSYVDTPVIKEATAKGLMEQEFQKTPMGRAASMDEVSDTIVFMASPMASFMHGVGLPLDGGYSL